MSRIFRKQQFPRSTLLVAIGVAGFLLAFGAAGLLLAPRVVSFEPSSGKSVGGFTPIQIRFSAPMDPVCTEARFSLQPAQPGRFEWEGTILRYLPDARWPENTLFTVTLQAGSCSAQGLPMLSASRFTFQAGRPRIVYLAAVEGTYHLRSIDLAGEEVTDWLQTDSPIQDFSVSPRGDFLIFTQGAYAEASSLWFLRLGPPFPDSPAPEQLLDCGGDACRSPSISPDAEWVAYERSAVRTGTSGAAEPRLPRVERLRIANPVPAAVSPADHIAVHPVWAPAGWLSYFDSTDRVITVDDLQGGRTYVANATGETWTWAPDSRSLAFPEITILEPDDEAGEHTLVLYSNLFLVNLAENSRKNLSEDSQLEDSSPAFSPDGASILFTRNFFDDRWTPGSQIWRINVADGSASAVTNLPEYGHTSIRWNDDGSAFLFMRFQATAPAEPPEIWLADSSGGNTVRLVTGGYAPQWLP